MRIAVMGAGISGLSIANLLKKEHEVVVYEKQALTGGLIKCERVNDCLFHKVGGHVFNSKNQVVFDWFWSFFDKDKEFIKAKRNAKVYYNGKIIGYPIENYIYHFERTIAKKIIHELIDLEKEPYKAPFDYENFEDFLKGNFGETLFSEYFKPYNNKIWRTDLKEVAMEWLEGKLPMPNFRDIILSNIIKEEEGEMVHSTFYYPKVDGSQFIVNRLSQGLTIKTTDAGDSITLVNGKIVFNESEVFDKVVFTGNIKHLPIAFKKLLDNKVDTDGVDRLKSNGTSNLFCETDDNDISWLYIPENFTRAHRIIYTGNFSDSNNRGSARKTCVVEFSGEVDYEEMVNEIKKLPGNLTPIACNYEANSYVVQDKNTRILIQDVKDTLAPFGIYLLGRFAEWEYYNMDKAIEAAMELIKTIK